MLPCRTGGKQKYFSSMSMLVTIPASFPFVSITGSLSMWCVRSVLMTLLIESLVLVVISVVVDTSSSLVVLRYFSAALITSCAHTTPMMWLCSITGRVCMSAVYIRRAISSSSVSGCSCGALVI